ncbi:hypothetical protein NDI37_13335 [Funiculus sociatus GB2-A5]|uniref:Uncharacterized protein n=1 Tax=Funiculus sociatus GB2-A5 TaxID=2933946 RepID=A0ABV0JQT4_9CYAN|nr:MULTISPECIES: hypothetical protein [unclassified Trichocoleus]MBD1907658.1 hypothetical protein [Trichocoleus sp. FACHB-832]MBD2062966.1 hypothetical protein [Trichocoleus sp. FACHB-6]
MSYKVATATFLATLGFITAFLSMPQIEEAYMRSPSLRSFGQRGIEF